jgi:iron complex outermembrane receptor protein
VNFKEAQNSGNPLLNSPRFKVSMTAEQTFPLGKLGSFILRYDGVWTDKTYYDPTKGAGLGNEDGEAFLPDDTIAQPAYWLHNLRATWRSQEGRLEFAGWVRNMTNEAYKTFAFDGSTFQATTIYFVGDPRTYGVTMMVKFF